MAPYLRLTIEISRSVHMLLAVILLTSGCSTALHRYAIVDEKLAHGDAAGADAVVQQSANEYGAASQVLYAMDRGMLLQLAG